MRIAKPSPNHNARPHGEISLIVLHADASPSEDATISWLVSPVSKVSYHTLIGRNGDVYEIVAPERRAWHAGVSEWEGRPNVNDFSLGLCFANKQNDVELFTEAQYSSGAQILAEWMAKYPRLSMYNAPHLTTHAACARPLGRKHDPGQHFDVARLINTAKVIRPR